MKRLLLAAAVLGPAAAGATSIESLSVGADRGFFLPAPSVRSSVQAAARLPQRPASLGAEYGRMTLAPQFDKNLFLLKETFGSRLLDVGLTIDSGAKKRFLTFTDASGTAMGAIGSLSELRGKGVDIRIDANTSYNFRVEVGDIFDDPVHKSIVHMTPINGTVGPSHDMTTGALLDDVRAQSALVTIEGEEYWIFYGRDALSDGSGFAATRSFLFTHMAGTSSKGWPVAEADLKPDVPAVVAFGDVQVQLTRTSSGELIVAAAN